jgi:hypothetical protein
LVALASGELVGQAAASEARQVAPVGEVGLAPVTAAEVVPAVVGEPRDVSAPPATGAVRVGQRALPVWGAYDVVVVGGGTAGAPAGIGAARAGARTLVVEYLDELGGVGTAGLIGSYWYGRREGFTREIEDAIGGSGRWPTGRGGWNVLQKAEWLRRELLKAGAELWFGAFGCGALLDQGKVSGVVVATPAGRGVVLAKTVVDATGNADIADCAGAETQFGVAAGGVLAVQLAGYPHRNLGDNVNNTCFALVDDTSVVDVWHLTTWMRAQMAKDAPYDARQLLDTRERRRIVADYTLTTPDILTGRRFADTISHHKSNFDASAFPTSPLLLVKDMKGPAFEVDLPYRCLLPKGLDGLLVTGLGAGAERDAMTLIRMQADVQNQGYAAGLAAAMAAAIGGHPRQVDRRGLQARLVAQGVLAERVLTDTDVPPSDAALARAVAEVGAMSRAVRQQRTVEDRTIFPLAMLMAHGERARPLLRQAYAAAAEPGPKLTYAQILGVLGDATGADTLAVAVAGAATWDQGYGWTSHRESDNTFSELDRLVIALGWSGARAALPVLVAKLGQLAPDDSLSHFVALALALHRHDRPASAAADLARLLATPGFAGHALLAPVAPPGGQLAPRANAGTDPRTALNTACRELLVAGMLVHCGDQEGRGQAVLETYARGVYGHFARYARHLLPRSIAR